MTHRERILTALDHREPDRVPMDLGGARFSGITKVAYEKLRTHMGLGEPGVLIDRMQQVYRMDERILEHLDVDVRGIDPGNPDRGGDVSVDDNSYRDEWGVVRTCPPGTLYYDLSFSPLAGSISAADIARYSWPDPADPGRFRGLREIARRMHEETDYAIAYGARYHLVHQTQYLRGFHDWFLDLAGDHDLFTCLMDAVVEILIELNRGILAEIGDYIDIVAFGDDIGMQDRGVCSLPLYRKLIRPYQERIVEAIRRQTKAKILYHSCGSVYRYINDFIEIGIDALNPVQVSAKYMDPVTLKREFGDRITFWGGIDSQHVLPCGSPDDVRAEVRRMFEIMGPGGGYVLGCVHNVQPDVPSENVMALFASGMQCRYVAQ